MSLPPSAPKFSLLLIGPALCFIGSPLILGTPLRIFVPALLLLAFCFFLCIASLLRFLLYHSDASVLGIVSLNISPL
ncbi:hypothetical protein [Micromonospora sp. MH99]|uniref:hypothetical protein n=1 Tax=Micromonospora sp. MH99 TaxID=1945510 RepID=UPI001F3673B3|nr:hypothetical protein [Micromonospora sp. MH99]MCF0092090.1 hypothetical protein [Micromonospora sp. MH99]